MIDISKKISIDSIGAPFSTSCTINIHLVIIIALGMHVHHKFT